MPVVPSALFLAQFASLALAQPAEPAPAAAPVETTAPAEPAPSANDDFAVPTVPGDKDPLAPINRLFYKLDRPVDRFILRPAAIVYKTVVPHPLRDGARNAIQNFHEPVGIFNDVLQLRPDHAIKGIARFLLNSTLGIGGLFDIAKRKPFHLPHHENSFPDTLGYYGVGPLLYLYLPVLGPTTLRDFSGGYVDDFTEPRLIHKILHPDSDKPIFKARTKLGTIGTVMRVVDGLDRRAQADQELELIRTQSVDPYAALRTSYLQDRAAEIAELKARPGHDAASSVLDEPLTDPAAAGPTPPVTGAGEATPPPVNQTP